MSNLLINANDLSYSCNVSKLRELSFNKLINNYVDDINSKILTANDMGHFFIIYHIGILDNHSDIIKNKLIDILQKCNYIIIIHESKYAHTIKIMWRVSYSYNLNTTII